MRSYLHLQHAVLDTPWAITAPMLSVIVGIIHDRATGGERPTDAVIAERLEVAAAKNGPRTGGQRQGLVAVLPVYGLLSPRAGMASDMSGGTSLESLAADFRQALADPAVGAIVLDVDSPGGSVEGVTELAAEIRAARGQKPIVAVANLQAASAAYWLAAQADEIVASPSSQLGSVGIVAAHEDWGAADAAKGVKTTLITAGKYKAEGNRYGPLDDDARAEAQHKVDHYYAQFTGDVAKGRGVPVEQVRSGYGQGRSLVAREAVAAGMADSLGTLDATVARLARGGGPSARPLAAPDQAALLAAAPVDPMTPCPTCEHPAGCTCTTCTCTDGIHDMPTQGTATAVIAEPPAQATAPAPAAPPPASTPEPRIAALDLIEAQLRYGIHD